MSASGITGGWRLPRPLAPAFRTADVAPSNVDTFVPSPPFDPPPAVTSKEVPPYLRPEVRHAILDRWPAIAEPPPPVAPGEKLDAAGLAARIYMGQELTEVLDCFVTPVSVARTLSEQVGGQADEVVANGKTRLDSSCGLWVVDHDGRFPGGGPILEVDTPPLVASTEPVLGTIMPTLQRIGEPVPTVGGGHIHVDGAPFLACPPLLSRFLQVYLYVEPALLSTFRQPMRSHAARGICEFDHPADLKRAMAALGESTPQTLPDAVQAVIEKFNLHREMALNLRSLCGVNFGNKKSKGTIEFRLFDTPTTPQDLARQHRVLRGLVAYALSDRPIPSIDAPPLTDGDAMLQFLLPS